MHVSKTSEGTRKRQKKNEEEAGGGRERIYIIVVEELSKELLATCEVHFEDCLFLFRLLLSIHRALKWNGNGISYKMLLGVNKRSR